MTVMEADAVPGIGAGSEVGTLPEQRLHPLLGAVEAASSQVQAAGHSALWSLSDGDVESGIDGCERLRAQVHHLELGLIAEADGRALATRLGAASTTAWLRHRFRIRPGHAKSLVHTANAITDPDDDVVDYAASVSRRSGRELRETGKALAEGAISPEHAATVDKIMGKVPREISTEQAVQAEEDLAGFCREFDPGTVAKLGDYMLEMMRTDLLDDEDEHRHRNRTLQLDDHTGGISGQLTREGIAQLRAALDPLAAPNPGTDGEPDMRSPGQRLADALVELARRALASDEFAANHGISHRVMVSVGLDSLTGTDETNPGTAPGEASSPAPPGSGTADGSSSAETRGQGEPCGCIGAESDEAPNNQAGGPGDRGADGNNTSCAATSEHTNPGEAPERSEPRSGYGHSAGLSGWWVDRPLPSWATRRNNGGVPPAHLEWGSLISASTARRIACHASVQRVLLDPAGAVLDVGRERRTVTPALYAALIARDGGCAFPGCTRPAAWCIAHHIIHWAHGGPTDLDNLVILCSRHHRVIHHNGWDVVISTTDRLPTFTPPRWIDPAQRPRRNNRAPARSVLNRTPGEYLIQTRSRIVKQAR